MKDFFLSRKKNEKIKTLSLIKLRKSKKNCFDMSLKRNNRDLLR